MITGPLFKWFGSKWQSAKTLPAPRLPIIIEPFAGSAGYSLRHCEHEVILCESNPNVYGLWDWLIHGATEADIRGIPLGVPEGVDIKSLQMSNGQSLLLKHWQRTNNVGNCWTISPWGSSPGQWTENTRARVASEFHHVKHWHILADGLSMIVTGEDAKATWFIDPQYQYNYQYGCKPVDYQALGNTIKNHLNGHVIVCEAVCPKTNVVPNWLPFVYWGSKITSRRKPENNHHSRELLYERLEI